MTGSTNVQLLHAVGQIESTRAEIAKREGDLPRQTMPCNWCWERTAHFRKRGRKRRGDRTSKITTKYVFTNFAAATGYCEVEYQLKAADANIGAARRAAFSSITLSKILPQAVRAVRSAYVRKWNVNLSARYPIFNAGRNKAESEAG